MTETMLMVVLDAVDVEPVVVETEGTSATLIFDDGTSVTFDRAELATALEDR